MISQNELLDMVATEAFENGGSRRPDRNQGYQPRYQIARPVVGFETAVVRYDLRLVSYPDGRLEWRD